MHSRSHWPLRQLSTLAAVWIGSGLMAVQAGDWPQFRGVNRDGVAHEKGLLPSWLELGPNSSGGSRSARAAPA